jgi:anti-sigma regulatory factor (Ser/Thr protein kinase)
VGIVLAAYLAPLIAFLLIGGVWADRLPRQRVMFSADVVRAALQALLALLIFTDEIQIWQLVVIQACYGSAQAFFLPAYTGLVPRTVPPGELQEAQALSSLTLNLAELLGPAIATALVLGVGAGWAFLLDAVTFVVSALLLSRVRAAGTAPAPSERRTVLAELGEGFREVSSRPWLWVTVAVFALAVPLGYAPLFVLGPTIAKETDFDRHRGRDRPDPARYADAPRAGAPPPGVAKSVTGNTPYVMRQAWLPAAPEGAGQARAIVRDAARELGLDGETTWELALAATEAFANAVEHGAPCDPRGILMTMEVEDGRLGVEICDCGCFPATPQTAKRRDEGGRGMPIIAAIMDHLEVVPGSGTTRVRFQKQLAAGVR